MKTLKSLRSQIERELKEASIENAQRDAQLLICYALNIESIEYATETTRAVSELEYGAIAKLVGLRISRMPMSQIFGDKEFWSLNFKVTKDTLTPRPDSETLIEAALKEIKNRQAKIQILDMGTGTGCLLLSLLYELPNAQGLGIDISQEALTVAIENAKNLGLSKRADFKISNWAKDIAKAEKFDIIICNPPYIGTKEKATLDPEVREHEPAKALFSGEQGFDDYQIIAPQLTKHLKQDGIIILEIGYRQADKVKEIFINTGFNNITVLKDLGQRNRCLVIKQ